MSVSFNYSDTFEDTSPSISQSKTVTPLGSARREDGGGGTSLMHLAETEEIITVFQDPTELVPTVFSHTDAAPSIMTEGSMDTSAKTLPGSEKSDSRRSSPSRGGSEDTASLYSYSESFDVTRLRSSDATDRDILSSSDLSPPDTSPRLQPSQPPERASQMKIISPQKSFGQSFRQSRLSQGHSYYDDTFEDYTEDITASVIRFLPDQELVKLFPDDILSTEDEEREEELAADRAQRNFISDLLRRLKATEQSTPTLTDVSDASIDSRETDPRVLKFCRKMVQTVRSARLRSPPVERRPASSPGPQRLEDTVAAYGLNPAAVERLRLKNLQARLTEAANAEIHDVKTCKSCREKAERLETTAGRRQFCQVHSQRLQAQNLDRRVEQHLANTTGVALIGRLAASLPLASETPADLMLRWQNRAMAVRQEAEDARRRESCTATPPH